ncbi:MAG: hypothetical protein ACYDHX_03845 [Methanothrix sp.]
MVTWQKTIKKFKAEKKDHDGEAATIILMYLTIKREDYPYHMARIFKKELKEENGWNEEKLKYLRSVKDKNQLTILLFKMEKEGFLESIKEQSGRPTRYYSLKTDILSSPFANIDFRKLYYDLPNKKEPHKDEACDKEVVRNFLSKLGDNDIHAYFVAWSEIDKFDFITFLGLLKKEAEGMKDINMKELIRRNIYDTQQQEKAVADLMSSSEIIDKMESENRKRKFYREPSIYERF